jgi:hypothetical protein
MTAKLSFLLLALVAFAPRLAHADESVPVQRTPLFPVEVAPPIPMGRAVLLHIDSSRPVTLELLAPEETRWRPLCVAPCDTDVPLDGIYRVTDRGMIPSMNMELEANPGDHLVLDVTARTYEQHATGRRLTITSYVAAAVGLGLEIGAIATTNASAQIALGVSGGGAAAVGIGCMISAWILLEQTSVSQTATSPATGRQSSVESPWTRLPTWQAPGSVEGTMPRVTNVPVWTARF